MTFNKSSFQCNWPSKYPKIALIIYFTLILPTTHFGLGSHHWITKFALDGYMIIVLTALLLSKRASLYTLGLSINYLKQNITFGCFFGIIVILSLPVLDIFVGVNGWSKMGHFLNFYVVQAKAPSLLKVFGSIGHTILDQLFFLGFIAQVLLKKINPYLAIYLMGILFAITHAKLTLGTFTLGIVNCLLYYKTGTLISSLIFQIACLTSELLLKIFYPRLTTLLGFLF